VSRTEPRRGDRGGRWVAAAAGVASGALTVAAADLVAGLVAPDATPVLAVGGAAVDLVPGSVKDFAVATFGAHDKQVLLGGTAAVLLVLSAVAGLLARRRPVAGLALVGLLGGLAAAAAVTRPGAGPAAAVPRVDPDAWRLRVHGLVDREVTLSFDDVLRAPLVERTLTLTCVSNEVGGRLAGTATWLGLPLAGLLERAGVRPEADMVLSTSADGFTASTPVAALTDGRDALLAVGMNGEALPVEHGFPARLVVPGLFGYVSATKWVVDLELTRFDRVTAYWTDRGWAAQAPVRTASRIDVPAPLARIAPGLTAIAGVAWAQRRGLRSVEVRGDWRPARLVRTTPSSCRPARARSRVCQPTRSPPRRRTTRS